MIAVDCAAASSSCSPPIEKPIPDALGIDVGTALEVVGTGMQVAVPCPAHRVSLARSLTARLEQQQPYPWRAMICASLTRVAPGKTITAAPFLDGTYVAARSRESLVVTYALRRDGEIEAVAVWPTWV